MKSKLIYGTFLLADVIFLIVVAKFLLPDPIMCKFMGEKGRIVLQIKQDQSRFS